MKIRIDFVTNSSSSSYIAVTGFMVAIRKDINDYDKWLILSKISNDNRYSYWIQKEFQSYLEDLINNIDKVYDLELDNWWIKLNLDKEYYPYFEELKKSSFEKFKIGISDTVEFESSSEYD